MPANDMQQQDKPLIKVVVVGDGAVGKTCLLISYTEKTFPKNYVPTVFNNSTKDMKIEVEDGRESMVTLDLWDTAGQEEFDRIRYLSYRDTQVFFFCFSVVDPVSFENIKTKWLPEVKYHMSDGNKDKGSNDVRMLVGLKSDLRDDTKIIQDLKSKNQAPVDANTAREFASKNHMEYLEVSALQNKNVEQVFVMAVQKFLGEPEEEEAKGDCGCTLL